MTNYTRRFSPDFSSSNRPANSAGVTSFSELWRRIILYSCRQRPRVARSNIRMTRFGIDAPMFVTEFVDRNETCLGHPQFRWPAVKESMKLLTEGSDVDAVQAVHICAPVG